MEIPANLPLITGLFALTVAINLPFGYFRSKTKRFSFRWFLYIHIPVPLVIFIRVLSPLDFKYIPLFITASVLGQLLGGKMEL